MSKKAKRSKRAKVARRAGPARDAGRPVPLDPYSANLEEQKKLSAGYTPDGKVISMGQLVSMVAAGEKVLRFSDLEVKQQQALASRRLKKFPRFQVAVVGFGLVDQKTALRELKKKRLTELGCALLRIEGLMIARLEKKLADWPRRSRPRPRKKRISRKRTRRGESSGGAALSGSAQSEILCLDSCFDEVTSAGRAYRRSEIYPELKMKGYWLEEMCSLGSTARAAIHSRAQGGNIVYITGIGHGDSDEYQGSDGYALFKGGGGGVATYAHNEVAGTIAHFLSCETARTLGPDFINNGCRAYLGYDSYFFYPQDKGVWPIFMECDSAIDVAFAEGNTAQRVLDDVKALFGERIADMELQGADYAASQLKHNMNSLQMLGDPGASLP